MSDSVGKLLDLHFMQIRMVFQRHPTVVNRGWLSDRVPHRERLVVFIVSLIGEEVNFSPDLVTAMDGDGILGVLLERSVSDGLARHQDCSYGSYP